ncbi:EAL domain-containing protein [Lapidilactobacillus luobeiensis]|uniref:EAL domain-containing protein n=1 Tax=Lapidilactobacillus luobeiensis TaxID=2950371 RepID=UPI0021C484D8|nr:EAL domain-containing protein [Lapidilactobacillus luobeiensis]
MYRFFAQPQINSKDNSVYGYEVLLRQKDCNVWHLPKNFSEVSIEEQAKMVETTVGQLNTAINHRVLAFNINQDQVNNPLTLGSLIALKKRIDPAALMIELTEAPTLQQIKELSMVLHQYGIGLVIDDVGTGSNTYENIRHLLPYVDQIKLAMQNLRENGNAERIPEYLKFWSKQAHEYRLDVVLEGIEDEHDQNLAHEYGINIHQGYLYGRPSLV